MNFSADVEERDALLDRWAGLRRQIARLEADAAEVLAERFDLCDADVEAHQLARDSIYLSMMAEFAAAGHLAKTSVEMAFGDARKIVTTHRPLLEALRRGEIAVAHVRQIMQAASIVDDAVREGRVDAGVIAVFDAAVLAIAVQDSPGRTGVQAKQVAAALVGESLPERHARAKQERTVEVVSIEDGLARLTAVLPEHLAFAIKDRLDQLAREISRAENAPDAGGPVGTGDLAADGAGSDGAGSGGAGSDCAGSGGGGVDGADCDRARSDRAGSDGVGSDGVGSEGAGSEGVASAGAGSDGVGRDGAGFDGAGGVDDSGFDAPGVDGAGFDRAGFDRAGFDGVGSGGGAWGEELDGVVGDGLPVDPDSADVIAERFAALVALAHDGNCSAGWDGTVDGDEFDACPDAIPEWVLDEAEAAIIAERMEAAAAAEPGAGTRTMDQIRADVLADLLLGADPTAMMGTGLENVKGRIQVTIAATTLAGADDGMAEIDGIGPLHPDVARELASGQGGWTRLFLDAIGMVVETDSYAPTESMRRFLHARDQRCRFPGCRRAAVACEIDHNLDHALGGPTSVDNLACFCHGHHLLKHPSVPDRHRWTAHREPDGDIVWTAPNGRQYRDRAPRRVMFI